MSLINKGDKKLAAQMAKTAEKRINMAVQRTADQAAAHAKVVANQAAAQAKKDLNKAKTKGAAAAKRVAKQADKKMAALHKQVTSGVKKLKKFK